MPLGFIFEAGGTAARAGGVERIIRAGIVAGEAHTAIIGELKGLGLGYRYQNMLADIRRFESIAHIDPWKTEKVERALNYFDNVAEPYRADSGKSMKQVWQDIHKYRSGVYESDAEEIEIESSFGGYDQITTE